MRGHRWSDYPAAQAAMHAYVAQSVGAGFKLIEDEMFTGLWVIGAESIIADFYLFTLTQWLDKGGVDIATLPKIQDHHSRMAQRPSVVQALARNLLTPQVKGNRQHQRHCATRASLQLHSIAS